MRNGNAAGASLFVARAPRRMVLAARWETNGGAAADVARRSTRRPLKVARCRQRRRGSFVCR